MPAKRRAKNTPKYPKQFGAEITPKLPKPMRQPVLILPRLTAEDLARETGLPIGTIRNYLDRGRAIVPPPKVRLQIAAVLARHASDLQRAASVLREYAPPGRSPKTDFEKTEANA